MEPTLIQRKDVDTLVGTKVGDIELYRRAFTHKSALKQYELVSSNETLEFMGDSVLGFVITKFLFDKYEKNQEGFLTRARTKLVRGRTLCAIAEKLGLDKWIWMDDKGVRNGWSRNPKIKDSLMRWCQANKHDLPEYVQDAQDGTRFRVLVYVLGARQGFGCATTKKEAEQIAACFALKKLNPRISKNTRDASSDSSSD